MNGRGDAHAVACLVCVGIGLGVVACGGGPRAEAEREPVTVRLAEAQVARMAETAHGIGTLQARQTVELEPEVAGRIETIHFEEGARVEEGELLYSLDDARLRHERRARRQQLKSAKARLAHVEQTYLRRKKLMKSGAVAREARSSALAQRREAAARVDQLRAELAALGERLQDTRIRAPMDGTMSDSAVDPGDYVNVGERLGVLYSAAPVEVTFTLPERLAGRVHAGQRARIVPAGEREHQFGARIIFVSPSVAEGARDLRIKARSRRSKEKVRPGMSVDVEVTLSHRRAVVIPAESVIGSQRGRFVFVVQDGAAHRRPVELGLRKPGYVEIASGLEAGAPVVREGHMQLRDGDPVKPVNGRPEGEPTT